MVIIMTKKYNELLSAIEDRITSLSIELANNENYRYNYLDNFFEKVSVKNQLTLFDITRDEMLFSLLLLTNQDKDYATLSDMLDENVVAYLETLPFRQLDKMLELFDQDHEEYSRTIKELRDQLESITNSKNISQKTQNTIFLNKKLRDICGMIKILSVEEMTNIIKLLECVEAISEEDDTFELFYTQSYILKRNQVQCVSTNTDLMAEFKRQLKENILTDINTKELEKVLTKLYNYYIQLGKDEKAKTRNCNKRIYRYAELKNMLKVSNEKEEITNVDAILEQVLDDDIKRLCLEYIYEHNMQYYGKLQQEFDYKNKNDINKYISYFNSLNIDFMALEEEKRKMIMNISIEDIKKKIKLLPIVELDSNNLVKIICNTPIHIIKKINDLLKNGYIDLDIISKNLSLYYDDNQFSNLLKNVKLLEHKNVNIREIVNKNILFCSNEKVEANLSLLDSLTISIKGLNNLDMLSKDNLLEDIEQLVEIGLEKDIVKQPEILNSDSKLPKRILISKTIGEDIYEDGTIKKAILDKEKFFVSDNEVDNYLFDRNNSEYNSNLTIIFTEGMNSKFSYDIEGVKIPKSKVSNLSVSLEKLIKPSLYSKEEVKILEKHSK